MSLKRTPVLLLSIIFFALSFLNLLSFIFLPYLQRWENLIVALICGLFGYVCFIKWDKIPRWQKWALTFIGLQVLVSFAVPLIMILLYPKEIGVTYYLTTGEKILWAIKEKISYGSNLCHRLIASKSIEDNTVTFIFHPLASIADFIYAGIIGIVVGWIWRKFTNRKK